MEVIKMETKNNVDHPSHYNREGAMECIDEMILLFGAKEAAIFCKLNAWKYRYRAADKNGAEDLKKSDWYLKKYKELTQDSVTISASHIATDTIPKDWNDQYKIVPCNVPLTTTPMQPHEIPNTVTTQPYRIPNTVITC